MRSNIVQTLPLKVKQLAGNESGALSRSFKKGSAIHHRTFSYGDLPVHFPSVEKEHLKATQSKLELQNRHTSV